MVKFEDLKNHTLKSIKRVEDEELIFKTKNRTFVLYHSQDWCENVYIEDICGDLDDIVGHPLLLVEEVIKDSVDNNYGSETWTFYKMSAIKGNVTIRWCGESNSYYSETVDFKELTESW